MTQRSKQRKVRRAEEPAQDKHLHCSLSYLRIGPRKVRAVINNIRGRKVEDALAILDFTQRSAAGPLARLLRSAVANAAANQGVDVDTLVVKEIQVDGGPVLKRFLQRAMGRVSPILKRTSHVRIVLAEKK